MKSRSEILALPRQIMVIYREDGGQMFLKLNATKKDNERCCIVFSDGLGWDHVSASFERRCPTWEEMCEIKDAFFRKDEVVIQYHPTEAEYVNEHPYCLHLWKRQDGDIPTPPSFMVGRKRGQSAHDAIREAEAYVKEYEARHGK